MPVAWATYEISLDFRTDIGYFGVSNIFEPVLLRTFISSGKTIEYLYIRRIDMGTHPHTNLFTQVDRTKDPNFFVRFMDEAQKPASPI